MVLERKPLEEQPQVREAAKFVPIHARRAEPAATLQRALHMHRRHLRPPTCGSGHLMGATSHDARSSPTGADWPKMSSSVATARLPEPERVNVSATIPGTSIECLLPGANSPAQFLNR